MVVSLQQPSKEARNRDSLMLNLRKRKIKALSLTHLDTISKLASG
jgi:hypothetical protein